MGCRDCWLQAFVSTPRRAGIWYTFLSLLVLIYLALWYKWPDGYAPIEYQLGMLAIGAVFVLECGVEATRVQRELFWKLMRCFETHWMLGSLLIFDLAAVWSINTTVPHVLIGVSVTVMTCTTCIFIFYDAGISRGLPPLIAVLMPALAAANIARGVFVRLSKLDETYIPSTFCWSGKRGEPQSHCFDSDGLMQGAQLALFLFFAKASALAAWAMYKKKPMTCVTMQVALQCDLGPLMVPPPRSRAPAAEAAASPSPGDSPGLSPTSPTERNAYLVSEAQPMLPGLGSLRPMAAVSEPTASPTASTASAIADGDAEGSPQDSPKGPRRQRAQVQYLLLDPVPNKLFHNPAPRLQVIFRSLYPNSRVVRAVRAFVWAHAKAFYALLVTGMLATIAVLDEGGWSWGFSDTQRGLAVATNIVLMVVWLLLELTRADRRLLFRLLLIFDWFYLLGLGVLHCGLGWWAYTSVGPSQGYSAQDTDWSYSLVTLLWLLVWWLWAVSLDALVGLSPRLKQLMLLAIVANNCRLLVRNLFLDDGFPNQRVCVFQCSGSRDFAVNSLATITLFLVRSLIRAWRHPERLVLISMPVDHSMITWRSIAEERSRRRRGGPRPTEEEEQSHATGNRVAPAPTAVQLAQAEARGSPAFGPQGGPSQSPTRGRPAPPVQPQASQRQLQQQPSQRQLQQQPSKRALQQPGASPQSAQTALTPQQIQHLLEQQQAQQMQAMMMAQQQQQYAAPPKARASPSASPTAAAASPSPPMDMRIRVNALGAAPGLASPAAGGRKALPPLKLPKAGK